MCKCHKRSEWRVVFDVDQHGMAQGYDGDAPLPSDRMWVCYQIIVYRRCTYCGIDSVHDALGACWAGDDPQGRDYLRDMVTEYGMLPRGIALGDCEIVDEM